MRNIPLLCLLSIFVCIHSAFGETERADSDERIMIEIRVISQLHHHSRSWNRAYLSPIDEFHHFCKALKESLEPLSEKFHFTYKRFPAKTSPDHFSLSVYLHEWKVLRSGMITVRFSARYKYGEESGKLGFFSGDAYQTITTISSLRDAQFHEAVLEASDDFAEKLEPILEEYFRAED